MKRATSALKSRWGRIAALGGAAAGMGIAAFILVTSAAIASVYGIAVARAEIATRVSTRAWGRLFVWVAGGLTYIAAASFVLARPFDVAEIFTLFLGAGLIATGAVRVLLSTHLVSPLRGPVLLAGTLTLLAGVLILGGWPQDSFLLGVPLGLDLLIWGMALFGLGWRLRDL